MNSKKYNDTTLMSDSAIGESSSMDFSELTSSGQDFGESFVEILRVAGLNEELLPSSEEVNDIIISIPGSEEFADWFCKSISLSNVLSEEEMKISDQYKHIPEEEIDEYLRKVLGSQEDKVCLTEETIDKLTLEESLYKEKMSVLRKVTQTLQCELKETSNNIVYLKQSMECIKEEIKKKKDDIMRLNNECKEESTELLEELKESGLLPHSEAEGLFEEPKLLSLIDLSVFIEKSTALNEELNTAIIKISKALEKNQLNLAALSFLFKEYEKLGEKEDVTHKYLNNLITQLENQVNFSMSVSSLAEQWYLLNRVLSSLLEMEAKQTSVTSQIFRRFCCMKKITEGELPRITSSVESKDSSWNDDISKLNQALTDSEDFATFEGFTQSLKEFDKNLTEEEVNMVTHLQTLNNILIKDMNTLRGLLLEMTERVEDSNGEQEALYNCKEKLLKANILLAQFNMDGKEKVGKAGKALYDDMLLLCIKDPVTFQTKMEEITRKLKLHEEAFEK